MGIVGGDDGGDAAEAGVVAAVASEAVDQVQSWLGLGFGLGLLGLGCRIGWRTLSFDRDADHEESRGIQCQAVDFWRKCH